MRQVEELIKAKRSGARCCLVLNFRKYEKTFAIDPEDFLDYTKCTEKKSISFYEAGTLGPELGATKKRVRFRYDLDSLLRKREQ